MRHFNVKQEGDWIAIKQQTSLPFYSYYVYVNNVLTATYFQGTQFKLLVPNVLPIHLIIEACYFKQGMPTVVREQHILTKRHYKRERDFKPGDILVASDNLNEVMTGYVGHSALVVDENHVIESPGGHPAITKDSIQQFLKKHPQHAQYRPKSTIDIQAVVEYAESYLKKYEANLKDGKEEPVFSFKLTQSLEDPWEYIYCSKLIWLSYYHGAGYELENDFLWFSPEDLYTKLKDNDDFELVYEHDEVGFHLNT